MSSPGNFSDLFWAFVIFAGVMVWVIHRITGQRREPDPRDQRQRAGAQGTNIYDASSHVSKTLSFTNNGELHLGVPKARADRLRGPDTEHTLHLPNHDDPQDQ